MSSLPIQAVPTSRNRAEPIPPVQQVCRILGIPRNLQFKRQRTAFCTLGVYWLRCQRQLYAVRRNQFGFLQCFTLGTDNGSGGTYNLTSGSLAAGYEFVGYNSVGNLTQSGGTNSVSNLYVGSGSGDASYSLSGSGLLTTPSEYIGSLYIFAGTGSFTQSGGTNTTGNLVLAQAAGSLGTYNLNGGLLLIGAGGLTQMQQRRGLQLRRRNAGGRARRGPRRSL